MKWEEVRGWHEHPDDGNGSGSGSASGGCYWVDEVTVRVELPTGPPGPSGPPGVPCDPALLPEEVHVGALQPNRAKRPYDLWVDTASDGSTGVTVDQRQLLSVLDEVARLRSTVAALEARIAGGRG